MDAPHLLCAATLAALPAQRAAISIDSTDGIREFLCASDEVAERMEWAQITLGEGPGMDANVVEPVVVSDARSTATPWPLFAREAEFAGVGAIYALPLHSGNIRIGVLSLYLDGSRQLRAIDREDAITVAVRLRAYSFACSRPLGEVAGDVVHNGLRIDTEPESIT